METIGMRRYIKFQNGYWCDIWSVQGLGRKKSFDHNDWVSLYVDNITKVRVIFLCGKSPKYIHTNPNGVTVKVMFIEGSSDTLPDGAPLIETALLSELGFK